MAKDEYIFERFKKVKNKTIFLMTKNKETEKKALEIFDKSNKIFPIFMHAKEFVDKYAKVKITLKKSINKKHFQ